MDMEEWREKCLAARGDVEEIRDRYLAKLATIFGQKVSLGMNVAGNITRRVYSEGNSGKMEFSRGNFYIWLGDKDYDKASYPRSTETPIQCQFSMEQLQGCCGVCVSYGASVFPTGKGIGTILNSMRIEMARNMGYGVLLCTDVDWNTAQRKILHKNGWTDIYQFRNPRTRNKVNLSVINLVPMDEDVKKYG